ncbi:MAG TPA: aryl-sulfate sulfotransferase [Vicinamibacterales bacterium]|nr:aryl-sulfate sulfotransferase [Vicinamibacterales bacterium]
MKIGNRSGVSRRAFFAGVAGAAGALGSMPAAAQATAPAAVDQNPIRRRGTGLRGLDPARAWPGLTLFAPMGGTEVLLIDLQGDVKHAWKMPYRPGLYGYLTGRGTLFYNGQIPNQTFVGKSPFMGGSALEMDWNGRVLWEVKRPDHHHDGRLLANGNIVLLCSRELPDGIARRVKGGRPGTEVGGTAIWGDLVVELTTRGDVVWEWRTWEHLDPGAETITAVQDERTEWTHANSVYEEPDGNLLVSFRNISKVIRIERATGRILWTLGAPPLSGQHAPHLLPNGHILLFDNGPHRLDESFPFSRVLEVDPRTNAIVWKYQEPRPFNFYSPRISNAQRLPNGNTLVNEGVFGRLFEVTSGGEVVWEYVNPHFGPPTAAPGLQQNSVFRAYRYSEEDVARARRM